jgi:autoinducer 2-degrading protein
MLVIQVSVHVKPDQVEAFRAASIEEDPTRFVLVEVYRSPSDPAMHKETTHYQKWKDAVEGMMAEPRTSVKYNSVFPDQDGWDYLSV